MSKFYPEYRGGTHPVLVFISNDYLAERLIIARNKKDILKRLNVNSHGKKQLEEGHTITTQLEHCVYMLRFASFKELGIHNPLGLLEKENYKILT